MKPSSNLRKRKQFSSSTSSNPSTATFTRSKSEIHLHLNCSGRACTDTPAQKEIHQPHLMLTSPLKKPKGIHRENLEKEASLDLSIKDHRARAQRIFSPASIVEEENSSYELEIDFQEDKCNGSSKILESCENFEEGLKGSDPDSGSGSAFFVSGKAKEEIRESVDPGIGKLGPSNMENDLNKITSPMKEKNGVDQAKNGNDGCENQRNGSISSTRMVPKSCSRRKVVKCPSSFSYRRLLPFLMDMAKDDSSTSRIEIVDEDFSCKVQNSISVASTFPSVIMDSYNAKHEHIGEPSDDTKPLDKVSTRKVEILLPLKGLDLPDPEKTEENGSLSNEDINHENSITGDDERIEECVQTTPPHATIFRELAINDTWASREINVLKPENHSLGNPSNDSTCSNHVSMPQKCHRSPRRTNTILTTKPILNPCSPSKMFKTSSSFSYRRLLPFLMDAAKSSANIDQSSKLQKDLESNQYSASLASSDKNIPLNKNETDTFEEKQEAKEEELNSLEPPSFNGYSEGMCPNLSTPFSSSSDLSNGKSNLASSANISELDVPNCLQTESTSQYKHVELNKPRKPEGELPIADFRVIDVQATCSAGTSCSTINHEYLPRESISDISKAKPVDTVKNCFTLGLGYHRGKTSMIKLVPFDHSSSNNGASAVHVTDSPANGILKRNPRGCRGLCNCLNCTSIRLHAERAFEYSRNQMLDAEEVAMGLINELAELRNMLGKSPADGNNLTAIQISQVKEACEKALKTEQQAKQRLSQMNDDLNVHCRIKGPYNKPLAIAGEDNKFRCFKYQVFSTHASYPVVVETALMHLMVEA